MNDTEPRFDDPSVDRRDVERRSVLTWALFGALFGLAFPTMGVVVAARGRFDIAGAHREQSVLYIVDLAPLVLCVVGALLGRVYGRLRSTRAAVERTVAVRTSELQAALEDLGAANARLVQAQRLESIGSLAAGVAHEINTPIQFVGDNVRFLQDSFDELATIQKAASELSTAVCNDQKCSTAVRTYDAAVEAADLEFLEAEVPSALVQTLEGVERVADIVRAMKDFSHPGSEVKEQFDVNKGIESTLSVTRGEWKLVADVTTDLDPTLPFVNALSGPLKQALLIIVVNAAQALEERQATSDQTRGSIRIGTSCSAGKVKIEIADDAGGIPEAIQDRVFEHFFTTKEVGKGSGQGLSIARSVVVDQHDGELTFDVSPGVGTTFRILLPIE